MKILISILSLLPLRALYALSDGLIYPLMYHVVRYRRGLSYRNLRSAFPEKSEEEILLIQKKFYHHLSDVIVEIIHSYRATNAQMREHIQFHSPLHLEQLAQSNQGVLLMLGHVGNWEYTADIQKRFQLPNIQHYNVYRQLKNHTADHTMMTLREKRSGAGSCIEKRSLLRHLISIIRQGNPFTIGLISDQKPSPGNDYYWTSFLNHDTGFLGGGEILARKYNLAVAFIKVLKPQRGQYQVYISTITDDPQHTEQYVITEQFARLLEQNIQEQPELWLWTHNRWKWTRPQPQQ